MLDIGTKAPDFTLPDINKNLVSLNEFRGKKVVLWFFPKANTPG
ncbi:redoxin domain-containing protein [bacterium]|nr:redoxin domain-containing protein [bacterium]